MNAAFALFQIDRVRWQVPMCNRVAIMVKVKTLLPDGCQELRIVAVENSAIQTQGRTIFTVQTENHGRKLSVKAASSDHVTAARPLTRTSPRGPTTHDAPAIPLPPSKPASPA